jgi:hypothetical protein
VGRIMNDPLLFFTVVGLMTLTVYLLVTGK